jgi:hypothetical protein
MQEDNIDSARLCEALEAPITATPILIDCFIDVVGVDPPRHHDGPWTLQLREDPDAR